MSGKTTITVAQVGVGQQTIELAPGATVKTVMSDAGFSLTSGEGVSVNGAPAKPETPVKANDVVVSSRSASGA